MSQHRYLSMYQGRTVGVVMGFERYPNGEFFLNVICLEGANSTNDANDKKTEQKAEENDDESRDDAIVGAVYESFADPHARVHDLGYFREKLQSLGIEVPESMYAGVESDKRNNAGNRLVRYRPDGSDDQGPTLLGQFDSPLGQMQAFRLCDLEGHTCIELRLATDPTTCFRLSVHLVGRMGRLEGPEEFYVKYWNENEPLIAPALKSGLFEDTGRVGREIGGVVTLVPPIWKIRSGNAGADSAQKQPTSH